MGVESEDHLPIDWRKSRFSADQGNCIEIAALTAAILVRDSKDISGPVLAMSPAQWTDFLQHVRNSRPEGARYPGPHR